MSDATATEQAIRITEQGKTLDYEQEALDAVRRSWDHAASGNNNCAALALADAQVWATLHVARAAYRR